MRWDAYLFGEDQSRILISAPENAITDILDLAGTFGVPVETIGQVTSERCSVYPVIDMPVAEMMEAHGSALERRVAGQGMSGL
jgi:hypothetical protein